MLDERAVIAADCSSAESIILRLPLISALALAPTSRSKKKYTFLRVSPKTVNGIGKSFLALMRNKLAPTSALTAATASVRDNLDEAEAAACAERAFISSLPVPFRIVGAFPNGAFFFDLFFG